MTGVTALPNDRQLVADVVRRALTAMRTGDAGTVDHVVRDALDARSRIERIRFAVALASAAADFASLLTPEQREQVFARLEASDQALAARALALLLTAAAGGPRD